VDRETNSFKWQTCSCDIWWTVHIQCNSDRKNALACLFWHIRQNKSSSEQTSTVIEALTVETKRENISYAIPICTWMDCSKCSLASRVSEVRWTMDAPRNEVRPRPEAAVGPASTLRCESVLQISCCVIYSDKVSTWIPTLSVRNLRKHLPYFRHLS